MNKFVFKYLLCVWFSATPFLSVLKAANIKDGRERCLQLLANRPIFDHHRRAESRREDYNRVQESRTTMFRGWLIKIYEIENEYLTPERKYNSQIPERSLNQDEKKWFRIHFDQGFTPDEAFDIFYTDVPGLFLP